MGINHAFHDDVFKHVTTSKLTVGKLCVAFGL